MTHEEALERHNRRVDELIRCPNIQRKKLAEAMESKLISEGTDAKTAHLIVIEAWKGAKARAGAR